MAHRHSTKKYTYSGTYCGHGIYISVQLSAERFFQQPQQQQQPRSDSESCSSSSLNIIIFYVGAQYQQLSIRELQISDRNLDDDDV